MYINIDYDKKQSISNYLQKVLHVCVCVCVCVYNFKCMIPSTTDIFYYGTRAVCE